MNVAYVNVFLKGSSNVLSQFGVEFNSGKPFLKGNKELNGRIIVLIGTTGQLKGQVIFNLDEETALKIVSSMMGGVEVATFDDVSKSALSELANMILGNTATAFFDDGISIDITTPSVLMGDNMTNTVQTPTLTVPMELNFGGKMELDISIKKE